MSGDNISETSAYIMDPATADDVEMVLRGQQRFRERKSPLQHVMETAATAVVIGMAVHTCIDAYERICKNVKEETKSKK